MKGVVNFGQILELVIQKCEKGGKFWAQRTKNVKGLLSIGDLLEPDIQKCERGGKFWAQRAKNVKGWLSIGDLLASETPLDSITIINVLLACSAKKTIRK